MTLIACPECTGRVSSFAEACPHCGFPIQSQQDEREERLLAVSPKMFGGNWFTLGLMVLLSLVVVGIPFMLAEWIRVQATKLVVTTHRTILTEGVFDRRRNEVRHADVRNVQVLQDFTQRLFGVGTLELSSAAQADVEIVARGIPNPQLVAETIWQSGKKPTKD